MDRRRFLIAAGTTGLFATHVFTAQAAGAGRIAAFVWGCSRFSNLPELGNAVSDATYIATRLNALGHHVTLHVDTPRTALLRALARFRLRASHADTVLFYLASHGLQSGGDVHVAATDSKVTAHSREPAGFIPLRIFDAAVTDRIRTRLFFVDACREITGIQQPPSTGTADHMPGAGQYIGYASQFGAPAFDGPGERSPFASALLDGLERKGLTIEELSRFIRLHVIRATGGVQVPWSRSSLLTVTTINPG